MTSILALEDYLPIYDEEGNLIHPGVLVTTQTQLDSEAIDAIQPWVQNAAAQGRAGEEWVKDILEREYHATVEKMVDRAGYDFKVCLPNNKEIFIEVKTSSNNRFFISRNEINTAKEKDNDYYLFYVEATGSGQNAICQNLYAMQNPFEILGLSWVFNADISMETATMLIQSIEIHPKDFQGFKKVPLDT